MESNDEEVRFYAAEALAYLDDRSAVDFLARTARETPAFRAHALAALGAMDDADAYDALVLLMDQPSAETRYGAFRALWAMRSTDAVLNTEKLGDELSLHVLDHVRGPPLVHVTRNYRPEVVIFGPDVPLDGPLMLEAGNEIVVRGDGSGSMSVTRFSLDPMEDEEGEPRPTEIKANATAAELARTIVQIGGRYPDVLQVLHEAKTKGVLECRLEIEATPDPFRYYERETDATSTTDEEPNFKRRRLATPVSDLFGGNSE